MRTKQPGTFTGSTRTSEGVFTAADVLRALAARLEDGGPALLANEVPIGRSGAVGRSPFLGRLQVGVHAVFKRRIDQARNGARFEIGDRMTAVSFYPERQWLAQLKTLHDRAAVCAQFDRRNGRERPILEAHRRSELMDVNHNAAQRGQCD